MGTSCVAGFKVSSGRPVQLVLMLQMDVKLVLHVMQDLMYPPVVQLVQGLMHPQVVQLEQPMMLVLMYRMDAL